MSSGQNRDDEATEHMATATSRCRGSAVVWQLLGMGEEGHSLLGHSLPQEIGRMGRINASCLRHCGFSPYGRVLLLQRGEV